MMKWWYVRMIGMCQYGFGVKWCSDLFFFPNGEMVKIIYGVMVTQWKFPMVKIFFWDTFPSMVKWWKSIVKWIVW